ncbi:restriction endonuclease subunit S [Acidithiobacillus sp.]|uniref:restriction endonuclease subunit S n=1 Tax=Acidithiobacillus sp. TaxID=1872118 RepID=UPI0025838CD8|nr:restriction endonuclease subunit S [Acidithiobacillus sp.]MDD5374723.1 restriction endonuclease subunit S [Acidithiobacillus sp.]
MSSKAKTTATQEEATPALVPKLRFPEFRGAWEKKTLETLGYFTGGGTPSKDNAAYWTGEIPWISSSDLTEDSISQINISRFITKQAVQDSATKLVPAKSILLVSRVGVGKLAISTFPLCTSQDFTNFTPTAANPLFLAYLLKSVKETLLSFNQGTSIKGFTKDNIASLRLGFPSPAEQQKIAECLSSVDDLIAAQAGKVDALKTHKKGLMQQLFPTEGETQPRLRFPEFQNAGEWKPRKAGTLFANRATKGEQGLPIYSVTMHDGMVKRDSFDRNFYDIEDAAGNKKVCKEDIAYNMMRMWQGALGVAPEDCLVSPAYIVLAPMNDAVPVFFQYLFKLPATLLLLTSHSRGLTKDRLRLYYDDFARIPLRCPALPEQQRIASCLSSLDALITAEIQKLEALKTHKKGLMQQLFPSPEETADL